MIDNWEDNTIKLLEIDPDKVKEQIEEIKQQNANAVIVQHPASKKCVIIDKRFLKRLGSEELGSWKEINR